MTATKVYIPDIGSVIECAQDWTFVLFTEYRNRTMADACGFNQNRYAYGNDNHGLVMLPAGTKLKIDRIYIRKGLAGYSSITFIVQETTDSRFYGLDKKGKKKLNKIRFWAKLADVNAGDWNLISDPCVAPE